MLSHAIWRPMDHAPKIPLFATTTNSSSSRKGRDLQINKSPWRSKFATFSTRLLLGTPFITLCVLTWWTDSSTICTTWWLNERKTDPFVMQFALISAPLGSSPSTPLKIAQLFNGRIVTKTLSLAQQFVTAEESTLRIVTQHPPQNGRLGNFAHSVRKL